MRGRIFLRVESGTAAQDIPQDRKRLDERLRALFIDIHDAAVVRDWRSEEVAPSGPARRPLIRYLCDEVAE